MVAYIIRRLLWTPIVLVVVSFVTFTLGFYGPGDPVQVLMGQKNDPNVVERIRKERGLDKPFLEQYVNYIGGVVTRFDFGESYKFTGQNVGELIRPRVWNSVQLGFFGLSIGVVVGGLLGLVAALKQGTWLDPFIVTMGLFLSSLPVFILQPMLAVLLSRTLRLLPSSGWEPGLFGLQMLSPYVLMPGFILALGPLGGMIRLMRASTLEVVNQDYVRTGRAKGLPEGYVRLWYIGRNSILPIITTLGLAIASLVEGGFIMEQLYGVPGMGRLAIDAFFARDYPIIMAITLLIAASYVLANLLIDIVYTMVDPRIRLS